jgi:predicted GIY-YIG superfamily endonuclease
MRAREKNRRGRRKKSEPWFLYILRCGDGTLYTGIAKNIVKRFKSHSAGRGARYTRTRLPLELTYQERCRNRTQALVREYAVKHYSKKKKESLIQAAGKGMSSDPIKF